MSDHRFERKVGQKLDDLKLTPSAKSWENIERELRKDKRRPAPIFWLPLLLLGLGAIGYFVFTTTRINTTLADNNKSVEEYHKPAESIVPAQPESLSPAEGSENRPASPKETISTQSFNTNKVQSIIYTKRKRYSQTEDGKEEFASKKISGKGSIATEPLQDHKTSSTVGDEKENQSPLSTEKVITEKTTAGKSPVTDSVATRKTLSPAETEKNAENSEQKPAKKKTKKWAFGINASGGVSSLSEGKLGFSNSQIASVAQNRQSYFTNASPAVVPPPPTSPSKIYPGLSFSVGLTTKYELSKRFSLSASVNYLQINTISKVGYKIEQTNNALEDEMDQSAQPLFLAAAAAENYRDYDNKYHFVEIPLTLHTRVNKSEKLPLYWNAGISFSQLIKSNSLHYDEEEHLYYTDDNLLKKMQTAVSTGFSFSLFNKTSRPLWVGPSVRYNISQALKKDVYTGKKHFMGLGIDVKWFLK